MGEADDGARAARIAAWSYLLVFTLLSGAGRALYWARNMDPTPRFEFVCQWVGVSLLWLLARAQARTTGSALPPDTAFFLVVFSFLAFPLLLWRPGHRWRAIATPTVLCFGWLGGYLWSAALHSLLVSR